MKCFPFFVDIENKKCLIVGGGKVAQRKVEKLLPYGPDITLCAPDVTDELLQIKEINILQEPFREELLENADMVIAATDDPELNHRISELCRGGRIPVNVVDDRDYCSFIFPALINRGCMTIGITTGGASPLAARKIRELIEDSLPDNLEEALEFLDSIRDEVKQHYATESERMSVLETEWERITEKSI